MSDKLIGVFKEVGKKPQIKVIWNSKEDIEKLIGGEYESVKSDVFTIIYRKNSNAMLPNVCIDFKGRGIGTSIKGNLFAVKENEKGEFCSFSNVEESAKVARFLDRQGLDYTNFDENGRYLTRAERKARAYEERRKRKAQLIANNTQNKNELNVSNKYFEDNFRLVPIVKNNENNTSDLNENAQKLEKDLDSTNESTNVNNKGKLILERTPDSSTTSSADANKMESPRIVFDNDDSLKMLLKIQLIILEFMRKLADEADE